MKILISDDEELARSRLRQHIDELDAFDVIAEAANGIETLDLCEKLHPDVVLLDIRMPAMDGIEAAQHLSQFENPPAIIFTTAYDQHVLKAFETNATDYLLKPVRKEKLLNALNKAKKLNQAQINYMQEINIKEKARTHICAHQRGNLVLIPLSEVIYFHADQKYIAVGTKKTEVLIEESLKSLQHEFKNNFMRVHRASLVAYKAISALAKTEDGKHVIELLHTTKRFEVSRRLLSDIKKVLKDLKVG